MEKFYSEEDLINFVKKNGPIEMHDMENLWRNSLPKYQGVHHYYIHDCATRAGSCGESYIYPARDNIRRNGTY